MWPHKSDAYVKFGQRYFFHIYLCYIERRFFCGFPVGGRASIVWLKNVHIVRTENSDMTYYNNNKIIWLKCIGCYVFPFRNH